MNSDNVKKGPERAPNRSLFYALGYTPEELDRPLIGVVSAYSEIVPGHMNLDKLAQAVKDGVRMAGGTPILIPAIGVCDGIAMGHVGMKYSLASRELICDSVETMYMAHQLDGLVLVPNCDKIVPGMVMAAVRMDVPAIVSSGGPMLAGRYGGEEVSLSKMFEAVGAYKAGLINDEQLEDCTCNCCPGCGSCSGMYTANSMNCLCEAIGIALPGNGTIPAVYSKRLQLAKHAGMAIMDMVRKGITARQIINERSIRNALTCDMALGCSTNTVLHLLAVAREAGVDFTMQDIDRLSRRVPVLCKVAPNSQYHIQDVNRAGGILSILGELARAGLLDTSVPRIDGRTLREAIDACDLRSETLTDAALRRWLSAPAGLYSRELGAQHSYYDAPDADRTTGCIRDVEHAYSRDGGLAVLTGNIARNGCIVKTAGVDESLHVFRGRARVYESQEQAIEGILGDEVQAGDVVVIRYEGPKGGPGMQEMLYPTSYLKSKHLDKACALITDGRFSGGTSGLSIGHVSPEAASGGEIAVVRTGDEIEIDIPRRSIRLLTDDAEIAARMAAQEYFRPATRDRKVPASLRAYAKLVSSADKGAVRIVDEE